MDNIPVTLCSIRIWPQTSWRQKERQNLIVAASINVFMGFWMEDLRFLIEHDD